MSLPEQLALWHLPGIGPKKFQQLSAAVDDIGQLFSEPYRSKFNVPAPDWPLVERALRWAEQPEQHIVTLNDSHYPPLLRHISYPPPLLYVRGKLNALTTWQLAMVGSRNPSPAGLEHAQQFAAQLAKQGVTITSGLALGIDSASHRGALAVKGQTIAVLGTGLQHIYPRRHRQLAEEICQHGAIVSEFSLNSLPRPQHFPQRNRLISGMCHGVLVVEAALKSGSLITAHASLEQNREVFAIPGSIHYPLSRGCHYLIKQGAKLVESVSDVLEEWPERPYIAATIAATVEDHTPLASRYQKLVKCVADQPTSVELIVSRSKMAFESVSCMLVELELQGIIQRTDCGYIRVR